MTKKLPDLIDDAEENWALMVPFAVRKAEDAHFVTGFTMSRMAHSIDIYKIIGDYVDEMSDVGRALRLVDYLRGKAVRNYPWKHRDQLHEDITGLVRALGRGGYGTEE